MNERVVTIRTCQGIGDLHWCYQKLAPYFEVINLEVLCVDPTNAIQRRSEAFCHMLQKVGTVLYAKDHTREYSRIAQSRYAIERVRRLARGPVDYAVNAPLESGVNLRDIDPGSEVEEFVDLGLPATVERSDYLCVFVAGAKGGAVWPSSRWVPAIERLARRLDTKTIRLIGASWDKPVQDAIFAEIKGRYDVREHVGATLPETIDIIRRSRFFLGYQSGLNVIAENYDVPQLMLYFDKLRPMLYTWCKPASVLTTFHATTFSDDVDKVIDGLPLSEMEAVQ